MEFKEGICQQMCILDSGEGAYVGCMAGSFENINTINIQYIQLMPEFLGKKVVRIIERLSRRYTRVLNI